ncbi:MAG: di-trans,poly-cis-decaprenylcistransferase [Dehalococcoidia bacterium]|nr:MAG: di-trans,poly-cis-decaprenylcistransferase [Dehalococcoidia bacterium]
MSSKTRPVLLAKGKKLHLPNHIAIIVDGNGRWAEQHGLPRFEGHLAGIESVRSTIRCLNQYQIKYVTLYGFSTENWNRPKYEVMNLFRLLEEIVDKESQELHKLGVKIRHLGRLEELPQGLQQAINRAIELTKNNTGMTLSLAFNYGGRTEILDAVRAIIAEGVPPQSINEKLFNNYLYTAGLPDVDLIIRTGGELRISNFLIWQASYSEYYFTDVLWPDFGEKEIEKALLSYSQRQRRFGGL